MASTSATASPSSSPFLRLFLTLVLALWLRPAGAAPSAKDLAQKTIVAVSAPAFSPEEKRVLMNELGITVGSALDMGRAEAGIRSLVRKGRMQSVFLEAETEGSGIRLVLNGNRVRVLKGWDFEIDDDRLVRAIRQRLRWSEGMVFDSRHVESWRTEILNALSAAGYEAAQVRFDFEEEEGEPKPTTIRVRSILGAPTRISRIEWHGVPAELKAGLESRVKVKEGGILRRVDLEASQTEIETYLRDNGYPESKVVLQTAKDNENDGRRVSIKLSLGGKYLITFFGNEVYNDFALRSWIRTEQVGNDLGLRIRGVLEKKYREVGYAFVKVEVVQREVGASGAKLTEFRITEGPRVRLDSIKITSRDLIGNDAPIDVFESVEHGVLRSGFFWEEGLKETMVDFRAEIQRRGYLNPIISDPKWFFSEDKKGVRILFDLDLGRQTQMGSLEIVGLTAITQEEAGKILGFATGTPFNRETLLTGRRRFVEKLRSLGYLDVDVSPGEDQWVQFPVNKSVANLAITVKEGTQYRVGKITIQGQRRTKEEVIARELRVKEGDLLDPEKVRQSEEEISVLGLFNRVEVKDDTSTAEPGKRNLIVTVRESEPGLGEIGLGGLYEDPLFRLRAFGGIAYRNVMGLNHTISTRGELALPISRDKFIPFVEYGALLGYRAPYFLDLPFVFSAQVGLDSFQISAVGPKIQTRARIEGKIERKLSDHLTFLYRLYRIERSTIELLDDSAPDKTESIGSTGPGFIFDYRDDIFNPTKGSYHTLDLEFAHPALLSSDNIGYFMTIARNSFYVPLVGPFSMTVFGGLGYAQSVFGKGISANRLSTDLALGGQPSIRGFDLRGVVPQTASGGVPSKTAYWNARAELACMIFNNFSLAVFVDSGQIFPELTAGTQRTGLGGGFRYKTPVGPVVIDVAQGLGKSAGGARFYFTVGTL